MAWSSSNSTSYVALMAGMMIMGSQASATDVETDLVSVSAVEHITIIGSKKKAQDTAGAANYVGTEELEQFEYQDINRILRLVPGVNIEEEDGFGLRPNIGIRGTETDRSSNITLMEDGVLIAPAPYAAPSAYYFPVAGRIEAIEVMKGASAIRFGPRTTGGAINLISTTIPTEEFAGFLETRIGSFDGLTVHAGVGGTSDHFAYLVETFQSKSDGFKDLDGGGNTGYDIEDYTGKFRWNIDGTGGTDHHLEVKLSKTENDSNESYLGLSDADFAQTPYRRYAASALDNIKTDHEQVQLTHYIKLSDAVEVTTVGYRNDFYRDWFKLDDLDFGSGRFSPATLFGDPADCDVICQTALTNIRGEGISPDDAIQYRHNARDYYAQGIQTRVKWNFTTGSVGHLVEVSARYHADEEDRLQYREGFRIENGDLVLTSVGEPGSQANRVAKAEAWAFYVQDEVTTGKFKFVPGLRVEVIELSRFDYASTDPARTQGATGSRQNDLTVALPGLGVVYSTTESLSLIFGINKGFNAPGASSSQQVEAEESINYEAGLRYSTDNAFLELIGFYNDYSNLLGTCTASSGAGNCDPGDQFNGGKAKIRGLEVAGNIRFDLGDGFSLPVNANYTFTNAEFRSQFESDFFGDVVIGDKLPHVARHQGYASVGIENSKMSLVLSAQYTGDVRTVAGQGPIDVYEKVGARVVFDTAAYYQITENVRLFGEAQNLFDKTFEVSRRPYGLRPGLPRTVIGGISLTF